MHPVNQGCAVGCTTRNTDIPMCRECRERFESPFGMSYARLCSLAKVLKNRVLKPATPNGVKGSVRSAHKNQTYKYMRVRDRVGFNAATPMDLIAVCQSHATGYSDPLRAGFKRVGYCGWE